MCAADTESIRARSESDVSFRLSVVALERAQDGSATVEFLLILPLVLMSCLLVLQVGLLFQAWIIVHHAAFSAARSAIVVLPTSVRDSASGRTEGINEITGDDPGSPKVRIVQRAAALVTAAISPVWTVDLGEKTGTLPAVEQIPAFVILGALFPAASGERNAGADLAGRYPYSSNPANTMVKVSVERIAADDSKLAEPVLVRVELTYRYFLAIPFADRVLGEPFAASRFLGGSAYFRVLRADFALPADVSPLFPRSMRPGVYFETEVVE